VSLSLQLTFDTVKGDEAEAELSRTLSKYHAHRWTWLEEREENVAVGGRKVKAAD